MIRTNEKNVMNLSKNLVLLYLKRELIYPAINVTTILNNGRWTGKIILEEDTTKPDYWSSGEDDAQLLIEYAIRSCGVEKFKEISEKTIDKFTKPML